ncbi:MAG: FAD-dependent oxidoreductase [Actinomycetota bacterium]|nr:FAD-dependent oxidoreductase [Actinomycetota bacterium]
MPEQVALVPAEDVATWDETVDVVVVGYGIAGACAALEAQRAGADVLVVDRAGGPGGSSIVSSGIFYLGGGTALQRDLGHEDDPEEMYKFLLSSTNAPDASIVRRYCLGSPEHFDWLEAQGVPFERSYFGGKSVVLTSTTGLFSTGNEKAWPFREIARPAPRGHKVAGEGEHAGAVGMQAILATCQAEDLPAMSDTRVTALVAGGDGGIIGVRARRDGADVHLRAGRGVVLGTGGFNFDPGMLAEHVPSLAATSEPLGVPGNDGSGIVLGVSAGASTQSMGGIIATGSFYPPSGLIKGVLVNLRGERFVAEDAYHGRTAGFIMEQPEQRAFLVVDAATFAYPKITAHRHTLVDGWETVEEMERALGMPAGALVATLAAYNEHAASGEDPQFMKHPDWVVPLTNGPWAAFDVSFDTSSYLFMTLGGLRTDADARVLTTRGRPVPGLYAAGACASTIAQDGKGYASGLSLGPGSFFGRVAGRHVAHRQPA